MMYGAGDFLGTSWEVVIKLFRQEVAHKEFATVADCADAFLVFIQDKRFSDDVQESISFMLLQMKILEGVKGLGIPKKKIAARAAIKLHASTVKNIYEQRTKEIPGHPDIAEFRKKWRSFIKKQAKDTLGIFIPNDLLESLVELLHVATIRNVESDFTSGIVIAGFGKDEMFPRAFHYMVDGRCDGFTRTWLEREWNLNNPGEGPFIAPFGQADIVHTFMEGIGREYVEYLESAMKEFLADKSDTLIDKLLADPDQRVAEKSTQKTENTKIIEKFRKKFADYRRSSLVDPILKVLAGLPKEEMAAMAMAMVEITSLRRRVDSRLESVGGPVDVGVISKGDGFIWIKRKHYFDLDFNKDFLHRKRMREVEP